MKDNDIQREIGRMTKNKMLERFAAQSLVEYNGELIFSKDKFAQLIVTECLKQIKDGMVDESELLYEHEETTECVNEALMDAHHNIAIHFGFAEHFGVEE